MVKTKDHISVPFRYIHFWTLILPSFSLISCLLLSILYNYEHARRTHCNNWNWFFSISSATGSYPPQKYIWRACIGVYCFPKMLLDITHFTLFRWKWGTRNNRDFASKWETVFQVLNWVTFLLAVLENLALLVIATVSMEDDRRIHEKAFIVWVFSMVGHLILFVPTYCLARFPMKDEEIYFLRLRVILSVLQVLCLFLAGYFFIRHNRLCENGAYSLASLFEWLLVAFNVMYHTMGMLEWKNVYFLVQEKQHQEIYLKQV